MLDAERAAAHLGITSSTLRRWARSGLLPASVDAQGKYHFAWRSILSASQRLPSELRATAQRKPSKKKASRKPPRPKPEARRPTPSSPPGPPRPPRAPRPPISPSSERERLRKKKLLGQKKRPGKKKLPAPRPPRPKPSAPKPSPSKPSPSKPSPPKPSAPSPPPPPPPRKKKKRVPSAKKSKKSVSRKKKRPLPPPPSQRPPRPSRPPKFPEKKLEPREIPSVRRSNAPTLTEAAPRFGVSPRTLLDWVWLGKVHGVVDERGVVHIIALDIQLAEFERSKPRPVAPKRPVKRRPSKKRKKRAKKSKRPATRPKPSGPLVENPFGGPAISPAGTPEPVPTAAAPMELGKAAQLMGHAMRDYVMARLAIDRELTHTQFRDLKHAFRVTYGTDAWYDTYDWIVDEWGLEPYIFDREALRDS